MNKDKIPEWVERKINQQLKKRSASSVSISAGNKILVYAPESSEGKIVIGEQDKNAKTVFVYAYPNSKIEILQKNQPVKAVRILALENSKVKYLTVYRENCTVSREAEIGKNASVDWLDASFGSGNRSTASSLNGKGAKTSIVGGFYNNNDEPITISASAVHNAPETASRISIRGASGSKEKSTVQTFTKISKNAVNSEGTQKTGILLISENARASARPRLEIDNFESKAGHSASVGRIDEKLLFYLMSRGLSEIEAVKTIVQGFFEPQLLETEIDANFEVEK